MQSLLILLLFCINVYQSVNAYLYPLGFKAPDTSIRIVIASKLVGPSTPSGDVEIKEEIGKLPVIHVVPITTELLDVGKSVVYPFYQYYSQYFKPYIRQIRYFPKLQREEEEEKVEEKTRNNFVLMIIGGLTIYGIIYFHITKRLTIWYLKTLKSKYVNNIKKFLKERG